MLIMKTPKRILQNKGKEVILEGLVQVKEVVKPEEVKSKVNGTMKKGAKIGITSQTYIDYTPHTL